MDSIQKDEKATVGVLPETILNVETSTEETKSLSR
jgi:hypothetical protein